MASLLVNQKVLAPLNFHVILTRNFHIAGYYSYTHRWLQLDKI